MKTAVIDALRMDVEDGAHPDLVKLVGYDPDEECAVLDKMDTLTDSLGVDGDAQERIRDQACEIFAAGFGQGFRQGFRLGVRLMVESLGAPEELEAGGGA